MIPQQQGKTSGVGYKVPPVATQFRPGQSGNPGGKPKGRSVAGRLNEILARTEMGGKTLPDGKCVLDVLAEVMVKEALKGKFAFAKEIWDRLEGKVPDRIAGHDGDTLMRMDFSGTDDEDLATLRSILEKLIPAAPDGEAPGD